MHRGIASVADLHLKVSDLFGAKASITGRRGLVCTGFATMGAEALALAGATLDGFSVGIHASDDMVRNDKLEEQGHAIARMTRGAPFCVSNQFIQKTKNALVGKGAIQWGNQANPLFVGDGKTMDDAVDKMLEKVAARKQALARKNSAVEGRSQVRAGLTFLVVHRRGNGRSPGWVCGGSRLFSDRLHRRDVRMECVEPTESDWRILTRL